MNQSNNRPKTKQNHEMTSYDFKAVMLLKRKDGYSTEMQSYYNDKNRIFSEIKNAKLNPPGIMSSNVVQNLILNLEKLLAKRELVNEKLQEFFNKLDLLNTLYVKREQEGFDNDLLPIDYKRYNQYTKQVGDLEYEWDFFKNEKQIIFDDFANLSCALRGVGPINIQQQEFQVKGTFFKGSVPPKLQDPNLKRKYDDAIQYKQDNYERLRREDPRLLYDLDAIILNLKEGKDIDEDFWNNCIPKNTHQHKKIDNSEYQKEKTHSIFQNTKNLKNGDRDQNNQTITNRISHKASRTDEEDVISKKQSEYHFPSNLQENRLSNHSNVVNSKLSPKIESKYSDMHVPDKIEEQSMENKSYMENTEHSSDNMTQNFEQIGPKKSQRPKTLDYRQKMKILKSTKMRHRLKAFVWSDEFWDKFDQPKNAVNFDGTKYEREITKQKRQLIDQDVKLNFIKHQVRNTNQRYNMPEKNRKDLSGDESTQDQTQISRKKSEYDRQRSSKVKSNQSNYDMDPKQGQHPLVEDERRKLKDQQYDIMKIKEVMEPYKAALPINQNLVPGMINEIKASVLSMVHEQSVIHTQIKGYDPKVHQPDPKYRQTYQDRVDALYAQKKLREAGKGPAPMQSPNSAIAEQINEEEEEEQKPQKIITEDAPIIEEQEESIEFSVQLSDRSSQWIPVKMKLYQDEPPFNIEKDFIEIYIDGGRHFPNNITISKQLIRIIDEHGNMIFPLENCMCTMDSDVYTPMFNYKFTISGFQLRNSRCFLHILYLTMEADSWDSENTIPNPSLFAFSQFSIFVDDNGKIPRNNDYNKLNMGGHQIALYHPKYSSVQFRELIFKMEEGTLKRQPGSTLLIRFIKSPEHDDKYYEDPPNYRHSIYDNSSIILLRNEMNIINDMFDYRDSITVFEMCLPFLEDASSRNNDLERQKADGTIDAYIESYLDDMIQPSQNCDIAEDLGLINVPLRDSLLISIDGLTNVRPPGIYVVVINLLCNENLNLADVFPILEPDWDSHVNLMTWLDPEIQIELTEDFMAKTNKMIQMTLLRLNVENDDLSINSEGFTFLPIDMKSGGSLFGTFQLPFFKAQMNKEYFQNLISYDPWTLVDIMQHTDIGEKNIIQDMSMFVRLMPFDLDGYYTEPFEFELMNYMFQPALQNPENPKIVKRDKVRAFDQNTFEKMNRGKRLKEEWFIPDYDTDEIMKCIVSYFEIIQDDKQASGSLDNEFGDGQDYDDPDNLGAIAEEEEDWNPDEGNQITNRTGQQNLEPDDVFQHEDEANLKNELLEQN